MSRPIRGVSVFALAALLMSLIFTVVPTGRVVSAEPIANDPFQRTWERTDQPVASGAATRTWIWGPQPFTAQLEEDYAETPGGQRVVQYFDKSRMEISNRDGDPSSIWYVTNGLLVTELITGRMQTGDNTFVEREPAQVNVAGDEDDASGPTYATFAEVLNVRVDEQVSAITQVLARDGMITTDESKATQYGVGTVQYVAETDRWIAAPFWSFMTQSGPISVDGTVRNEPLFASPFYATGYPISDAYWANVKVGGQQRDVLMQCFERRCLTWTPDNPVEWQVEMGNVGRHYYAWRYPEAPAGPNATANALAAAVANAPSDNARYDALLDVFSAIGVGVYGNDGTQILGGAERGANDFYLYRTEVQLMAAALGRGDTSNVADLARTLSEMDVLESGADVNPELLRQVLISGAQEANATPNADDALIPLIARQLGLTHATPYDLFLATAMEDLQFDALQSFLILASIALPIIAENGPVVGETTQIAAQTDGVLKMTPVTESDNPCDSQIGTGWKEAWAGSKWFLGFVKVIGSTAKIALVAIDGLHGSVLAYSVLAYSLDELLETHYGHDGEGQAINFRLRVEMVDELPENVIKCGWMLGVEFPKKGPIKDVWVAWDMTGLPGHGRTICEDPCKKTDANGVATLTFVPKAEANPNSGWVVEDRGQVTGVAMYQSRHKNALGSINQIITPKTGRTMWAIAYHETPGYTVELTLTYDASFAIDFPDPQADDWFASGDGSIKFTIEIPYGRVSFPFQPGDITYVAKGGGSYEWQQSDTCSGGFSGTWNDRLSWIELVDPPTAPGEMSRWVRLGASELQPEWTMYTDTGGNCSAAGSNSMPLYYGSLSSPPMFDLLNPAKQTYEVFSGTLCDAEGTEPFTSCEAYAKWEITVKPLGQ